jgi:hypothetical protein
MFHDEANGITTFATSKTFINLLTGRYRERRGFFIVKRAEAKITGTPFFQLYELADHIKDIDSVEYLLYGILGDHAGLQI